jgi:lipopolysaccharide/colanic/teichoic acid biosynthesis glycosyltransferase
MTIDTQREQKIAVLPAFTDGSIICALLLFLVASDRLVFNTYGESWWRYALYFGLSSALSIFVYHALAMRLWGETYETRIRLAFISVVAFSLLLSLYQAVIPTRSMDFPALVANILGALIGVLDTTWRTTGLVEVNSPPSAAVKDDVLEKHQVLIGISSYVSLAKRAFDIVLSSVGLILSAPLWILCSLGIWLEDPGPVFFTKICVTKGGKSFKQLKLRSMVKEAEKKTGPVLATEADPRMTWIGKLMRKMALDELPQLVNILKGEMSFVGPRPQRTVLVQQYLEKMPRYALRHAVRPGLTGVAQVYGHYYVTPRQKLRYDLIYVRRPGFWLDLRLFVVSFLISFRGGWQNQGNRRLRRFSRQSSAHSATARVVDRRRQFASQ